MTRVPSIQNALPALPIIIAFALSAFQPVNAQQARERAEQLCQIQQAKFEKILPEVMRENGVDMWIVATREGHDDPMIPLLGQPGTGFIGGYYVFTDRRGAGIERATAGIAGQYLAQCKLYDMNVRQEQLRDFIAERDPKRIAVDTSKEMGTADGLTHTLYLELIQTLGMPYAERIVSAEKLISDFRSRHVAMEIVAYSQAGELSRTLAERALSNEVITPNKTTLRDVAAWLSEQQQEASLGSSFGFPSVIASGAKEPSISDDHIIRPGELLSIDWGVGYLNAWADMRRVAYVLNPGESAAPSGVQLAFDKAVAIRDVLYRTIKPGATAASTLDLLNRTVESMPGYRRADFGGRSADPAVTDFIIASHSTGDLGHGSGPWIGPAVSANLNPLRMSEQIKPTNFLAIEFYAYTAVPEWGNRKISMGLEDDAVVTERGIEWVYPPNDHILLIK